MKILHITNEFSQKNFSISSLIIFITNQIYNKFNLSYSILVSLYDKKLFDNQNLTILDKTNWFEILFQSKQLTSKISNYDVIHIHGIWAPIQLLSILTCYKNNKNFIIHPHGMLLPAALKSGGYVKFLFKITFLYISKFLIKRKVDFVAITKQEINAIKSFFPLSNVLEISNPIPFEKNNFNTLVKKKKFVYFGRIHPHKNLDLIIEAFKKAKISEEWKFHIYGIVDDTQYLDKLNKLIGENKQIQIKDPIFNYEKQKILEESWLNILVSKSEVLSLSILEASTFKLPSLVNDQIEMKDIEDSVIKTKPLISDIKIKLEEICNWSNKERISKGISINTNVLEKTNVNTILSKYSSLYEDFPTRNKDLLIEQESSFNILSRANLKFFLITSAYMFNLMFSSFIVVLLVLFGHYSMAAELGVVVSFWVTITQIFSSNMRSIIISEQRRDYASITMIYRLFFSIGLILISYFLIKNFISFEYSKIIILFTFLILIQWINDMNLVTSEVKNKLLIFKFFMLINIILTLLSFIFLLNSNFQNFHYLLIVYMGVILVSLYSYYINLLKLITKINFSKIYDLNIKTVAFLSSFALVFSSLAWRIMIYNIFDKAIAGIFFACFSIGSFPGTLFNSVIGPTFVKQNIKIRNTFKIILFFLFIVILFVSSKSFYTVLQNIEINVIGHDFFQFTVSVSLLGSYPMVYAMFLRHKQIQTSIQSRISLFQKDIMYGFLITFLVPILYSFGGLLGVSFSFFTASLAALIIYTAKYNFNINA
jgi:glycosyltransferase involved in cell wall biosynthesis